MARTSDDWKLIAKDFENIWNLPHCIGAIGGRHVSIKSPLNSGLLCYNYKSFFSMTLMAICDARYIISLVDISSFGSNNDSRVSRNSPMGKMFFNDEMSLPVVECLEDSSTFGKVPYFLVGDETFYLQSWLLRPYPGQGISEKQRIFKYGLSRARRIIQNAFGILAARWRVFMQPIQSTVKKLMEVLNLLYAYITFSGGKIVLATVRWLSLILMTKQGQSKRENGGV